MIYFTADLHFFHKNILEFQRETRLGNTVEEMNELIVRNWNKQVSVQDTVYLLGDVSFGSEDKTDKLLERLNGIIHLVLGNHDRKLNTSRFESISTYLDIKVNKTKVALFHYPIACFNCMSHGAYHLYGHSHGYYEHEGRAMDVGIDSRTDMKLWTWNEIDSILSKKPILNNS